MIFIINYNNILNLILNIFKIFVGLLYFIDIYYTAKIFNNIIVIVLPLLIIKFIFISKKTSENVSKKLGGLFLILPNIADNSSIKIKNLHYYFILSRSFNTFK